MTCTIAGVTWTEKERERAITMLGLVRIEKHFDHNIQSIHTEGTVSNDMLLCASSIVHCLFQSDYPFSEVTVWNSLYNMNEYIVEIDS